MKHNLSFGFAAGRAFAPQLSRELCYAARLPKREGPMKYG